MTVRSASQANVPIAERLAAVLRQLGRIVVGKDEPLRLALACLLARGHLLIEDIPGVGKSTLAQALAATLGLKYARIQFTSDLLPADVLGVSIFDERDAGVPLPPRPDLQFGRARRRDQPRAAEDAERAARSDGGAAGLAWTARRASCPIRSSSSRRRIPVEQIGAYPLPESQLDRFLMAIELGYPDPAAERELLIERRPPRAASATLPPVADPPTLADWQREAADIHVAPALLDYVQALLAASRGHTAAAAAAMPARGAACRPRAGLMLLAAARAWAHDRRPPDGAARGRAGGVSVGRRPSARRRRARRRGAGAGAAARVPLP